MTYSLRERRFKAEGLALDFWHWMRTANPQCHAIRPFQRKTPSGYRVWVVQWETKA